MSAITKPNLTREEYHNDFNSISHSGLETFRDSPLAYELEFILKERTEPTDAMEMGTLTHLSTFEPKRYAEETVVAPKCDKRTKEGKGVWASFCTANEGKRIMTSDQAAEVIAITGGILRNPHAKRLIELPGICETAVYWQDAATGLTCRCMPDKIIPSRQIVLDLKTTNNPKPWAFAKKIADMGYHRQAAWYLDGVGDAFEWLFIAVQNAVPYECCLYQLSSADIELGRAQNRHDLDELARCMESNDWSSRYGGVNLIELPKYAREDVLA